MNSPPQSPPRSARRTAANDGLPDPYFTFNPGMLRDPAHWSYRDLQKLACQLDLGGGGKREAIICRLQRWHETQFDQTRNMRGSNFALLEVDVESLDTAKMHPGMLTPLTKRPRKKPDGTPIGILSPRQKESASVAKKKLHFSIFNGVKIIPPRPGTPPMFFEENDDCYGEEEEEAEEGEWSDEEELMCVDEFTETEAEADHKKNVSDLEQLTVQCGTISDKLGGSLGSEWSQDENDGSAANNAETPDGPLAFSPLEDISSKRQAFSVLSERPVLAGIEELHSSDRFQW